MKLKRFRNKFISMLLTLAMLLTLFPTAVFAEDTAADRPASAEFKIMGLYALRDNGRRVSFFSYESRDNAFLTKANMTYPDSWFKLIYVIERSQPVTLELYEMKDEPAYMDEDIVSMPYAPEDDADGHGKLQSEEFLGRRLGVLVGVPVQENIAPLQEGDDIYTAEQVSYSPIDEDEWLNIVYQTIRGKRQPEVIEDFYAFGFEGNRLAGLDDAAATVSLDELPAPEDMAETDALLPSENLDAPNPEANLSADINDEAMDTEKSPANETSEDGASEESLTTDTESATAIEESFAPSANAELLEDDTDTAPADVDTMDSGAEETNMADVPETSIEDEPPAEKPVEAVSDVEPEEQPEINAEIDYLPESSVLPSAHAFFGLTDAAEESENTIQNIVLWDGSYRDDSGSLTRISSGGRYVIVMQPCTPRTAIYNSFLGFDVPEESEAIDTFETINSWDDLIAIRDELACSGDPVDLLSGSFTWNYRDLALYGKDDLEFTRYYESVHADENYGLGGGWTSNFSYALEFDGRSVIAHLPRAVTLYFPIGFDGSFDTCGDYSLVQTGSGYAMTDKAGTIYRFDNSGRILSIVYLSGNTLSFQYDGDKPRSVSNGAGSFTFSYSGDNIAAVTDSVGRSIHLSYDGGFLTEVENPDGDSLRYAYDGNGYLSSVQNLKGDIYVENEYDAQGRVVHQYAVNFGTFDFTYDFDGRHNTCTGEDGYFHEIWFDEQGRITKSTDASGSQTVTYNDLNQVTSRTDREGNRTSYAYDAAGNKTKITYADGTYERFEYDSNRMPTMIRDRNGNTSYYTYDHQGNMTSATDGRGMTRSYVYDADGNLTSAADALGAQTTYTYDAQGNCTSMTDPLGNVTAYIYDGQGRLITVTDAMGSVTSYEYTEAGKLVKVIGTDGSEQTYTVDGNGFNISESDRMGHVTTFTRDAQNNVTSITDPLGNVTRYTYDDSGNLTTATDANGAVTRYTYDADGRIVSMTDARGNTWRYAYDRNGQLVSTTDPVGGVSSTEYNSVGRTASVKDANGNTTQYTYDGVGNLTKITDALGKSTVSEYDANGNLTAATDRNGHTTRYAYDAENRLIRMEDAEGSTTSYTYDANGQMTKTTSAMGAETSSTYDALGRQISSADALGHVTGYEYDVLGRATKITYADGGFVAYTYDANGQVLTATDELGGVISYVYDANGRLIEMTDAMGGKTAYAYDAVGNVTSVTDALGGSTTYRYDETGNMTSVTDANGNTTGYSYDALGRAVAVTDANGGVTRAEYDHNGNIVKAVDAEGNATTYVYDALDRLASYTNAEGYTFSFQYDNEGNTVSSTDGNGNTTRYTYDGLNRAVSSTNAEGNTAYNTYDADGRMVKSVNEEGAETAYAYDADGRLISMTDALGNVTGFEYDSRDRVIKVTDAKGNATTFTYDLAGNVKSETNAKGVVTSYAYDANGNLTSMTDAAGTVTYTYDALNRVTSVKDRRGNTQFFTYDATDRIVQVKDRNGNATRYVYDGNGNIVKTIDALGTESVFTYNKNDQLISTDLHRVDALNGVDSHEITLYEYDGRNLVTKEINALGDSTVYVYDGNGNLVSKTDADGYVTQYSYTALDLVKKINYNGAKEVSYQYNKVGELVQMDDWTGTNTFELDLLGRLQKMTDHKGNTVSYTYDAVGNQTGITYPDGSKTRSFYDAVYNLTSVIDADDGTYAYVYDAANRPVKLTYPNGWIEQYTYDAEGNLLKTVDTDPFQLYNKTPKVKYEYTYDAEGNVLTEFQRDSDATENLKSRTAFTYDALNRLTGSTRRLEVYPYDTLAYTYTYDTLGNLLKQSGPTKGEEDTYQYNDLNQMVSKHVCGYEQKLTRIYDYGYTYDKRGNLVKEEEICSPTTTGPRNITIATYLYDETNRMVQGTNKAGEVSAYTFNGLGVRVGTELILKDNTHGYTDFHCQTPSVETGIEKPEVVKTDYVIDYTRLNIDQRVLMKSEQDGYDFFYTYGLDKLQVMTIGEGSNWWGQSIKKCVNMAYVHTDRLGSVVNLSDQYGRVTARADYTDWGEVRRYTDITVDGGFRRLLPEITYATHEYDDVLNQFYAKARMYDAENKRFDAVDLIAGTVANPISLVQYLYVVDNPIKQIDPLGLIWIKYENIVSKRNNGEDASHSYSTELKKMQQMLNYMGYSNIPNGDMGVDYGGLTAAAVNLFQLNYQIKPTSFVNNTTYLTVANVYVNKRYSNKESQKAFYDLYVRQLMKRDGITNKDYYRKYVCVVPQGFSQSVLDNLPAGVSTKKVNGIWYFDYTDAMNKVLTENEKVVLEHQIPLYEDYVAEVGKNLTWFGRLVYNYNSAYQAKRINELLWFASMVKPNAEWDIKVEERWEAIFGDGSFYGNQFRFVFDDSVVTPEMMGNITYGYWGKALGVSDEMLYLGGGVANAGIEIWKLLDEYYGESEEDHLSVKWGIEYYNATH